MTINNNANKTNNCYNSVLEQFYLKYIETELGHNKIVNVIIMEIEIRK